MKRPANALSLAVLTLLFEKPMHPYEMSSTLRQRSKEESIRLNYGSLYAVVESLRKKGLITARETLREGNRPERTVYELTDDGATAMREWLSEMLRDPTPQFTDFEAALSLMGALPPEEALELLRLRLRAQRLASNQYDGVRAHVPEGFPALFLVEGDYSEALRLAEITFVEKLVDDITHDRLGGLEMWRRIHELRAAGHSGEEATAKLMDEFGHLLGIDP
ncbi:PadR family transcriptional regulator [Aeromicrobium ginsengisoli]|uniref:PadR family transcriptional regulator n=1 Tax=Aeromicrobium ginsengisoli TaxID=363867 RepID=A0A5M4FED9_9ACTN|nr:PadR family transcriptional regulator [Aeromicrobium ginsengisoli]KAA1397579.1 PadR family transcriptional regulator [Aeromicrobium ginsengisoli]